MPTPHAHAALIERFYDAFVRRDHAAMIACYHPEIHFKDEVFDLHGPRAGAMWHMLCERGHDLRIAHDTVQADERAGSAHWEARYTFGPTVRPVHNIIEAAFTFEDGLIRTHRDRFDFWGWSRMALGLPGLMLGWSGFLRRRVSQQAGATLDKFVASHPEYA